MVASTTAFHPSYVFDAYSEHKTRMCAASLVINKAFTFSDAPIYNPLGLYPISALKPNVKVVKTVLNNIKLYPQESEIDKPIMEWDLPFTSCPVILDVSMDDDLGFDIIGFASSEEKLRNLR